MTDNPIILLLRSRKFLLAVAGVVLDLVIALVPPEVAPRIVGIREELIAAVTLLIGVVIGGIAVEDHAEKSAPTTVNTGSGDVQVVQPSATAPPSTDDPAPFPPPRNLYGRN